jgi:hypothetical protein
MKLLKKFLFSSLASLVVIFSFVPYLSSVKAATAATPATTPAPTNTWYNQSFQEWYGKVYDPNNANEIFGERYTAAQVQWVIYGFISYLFNLTGNTQIFSCALSNQGNLSACTGAIIKMFAPAVPNSNTGQVPQNKNLLSLVFATDRPFSGISYVKEKIQDFSLVPVAHAQTLGFGFSALTAVQNMWRSFRDIAFGLFVIVAIVFAFMIMFRVKISPQTVVSVQSALPKIIVALILVTFSYAIAGFLVDFMYVLIGLVSLVMAPLIPSSWFLNWFSFTKQMTPPDVFNLLTVGYLNLGIFGLLELYLGPLIILLFITTIVFGIIGAVGVSTVIAPIVAIIFLILTVAAVIILLWNSLKIVWALIKAFAMILLLTIFAPIQIALGPVVPSLGFGAWLKSYVSNLAVFIVTGVLGLFAWIFSIMAWQGTFSGPTLALSASTPASPWPPLLGIASSGGGILFIGVSFVLFTLIPKANEVIQGLISGKPFAYGTAIGEAFGPISGAIGVARRPVEEAGSNIVGKRMQEYLTSHNVKETGLTGEILYGISKSLQRENRPRGHTFIKNARE